MDVRKRRARLNGGLGRWLRLLPVLGLLLFAGPCEVLAAAWNQDEGHGILILPLSPYWAPIQGYDSTGRPAGHGNQTRLDMSPYVEYGLSPRWTIGMAPRLQALWMDNNQTRSSNFGVAQADVFARYQVYRGERDVFAVQGTFSTPGFAGGGNNPFIAQPNLAMEARAMYGIGGNLGRPGVTGFTSLEAAYQYWAGTASDQVHLDATFGIRPWPRWMFLGQSFNTISVRNNGPGGPDYNIAKLQFSAVYDMTDRSSVQFGYMREIAGSRVALGQAFLLALWYRF
jgi:hypothetical protein